MEAIAGHLGISVSSFKTHYCAPSGRRWVLAQRPDGFCVFWDHNCTIHAIKPRMCRQWPYIDGVLKDIGNWKIMSGLCPGMRADVDENRLHDYVSKALGKSSCLPE
jgi:Fe-S-cluster containining protein